MENSRNAFTAQPDHEHILTFSHSFCQQQGGFTLFTIGGLGYRFMRHV